MVGIFRKWEMCTTLNQINCLVFRERILAFINVKKVLWTEKCKIWCKMEYESSLKQKFCNKNFLWMSLWMTLHRRFLFNKLKFITWTTHLKQKQKWKKNNSSKCNMQSSYEEKTESTELQAFKRQKGAVLVYRYTGEFLLFSYPYMELWRSSLMFRSFVNRYTRTQPTKGWL